MIINTDTDNTNACKQGKSDLQQVFDAIVK